MPLGTGPIEPMTTKRRLFVALEVPRDLCDAVAERAQGLKKNLPKARWVRPESMHLTLLFLGETEGRAVPALCQALDAAFAAIPEPLSLRFEGAGAFPEHGRGRTLWVGLTEARQGSWEHLQELRQRVVKAAAGVVELEKDTRKFTPHLTLARMRPPWTQKVVRRFGEEFGAPPAEAFEVKSGVLFESELRPEGPRYHVIHESHLGGNS